MTSSTCAAVLAVVVSALACALPVSAAPGDKPPSTSGRGAGSTVKDVVKKPSPADYGFCSGPQNPHATPLAPVKIVVDLCEMSQTFTATSPGPTSSTVGCGGGYAIAFGQKHNLSPGLTDVALVAEWADAPLQTADQCSDAKLAAIAWGSRCLDDACDKAEWEMIEGAPKQRAGKWESNACTLQVKFTSSGVRYKWLSLDMIATRSEGNQTVRKKAKGTIVAQKKDTKPCTNATTAPAAKK